MNISEHLLEWLKVIQNEKSYFAFRLYKKVGLHWKDTYKKNYGNHVKHFGRLEKIKKVLVQNDALIDKERYW